VKRLAVVAALAVALWSFGAVSTGGAQDAGASITITSGFTASDPSTPAPITVCVNDLDPEVMELGDQFFIDGEPGLYKVRIFYNDAAVCTDVPDQLYETSVYAGDRLGLVVAQSQAYTFAYDDSCVPSGDARLLVASALYIGTDVYLQSQADGKTTPFALGLIGGAPTSEVAAGTYDILVVSEGADPNGPTLLTVPNVELGEGTYTQVFLAGIQDGTFSSFSQQQGPEVCDDAEPPPEETTTTTAAGSSTTTSTTAAVAPATASPAAPVSGTATYTG
jgi:hypothetical protein